MNGQLDHHVGVWLLDNLRILGRAIENTESNKGSATHD